MKISVAIIASFLSMSTWAQIKKIEVQHGVLNYREAGSGEVVIFVHGTQEDYRAFEPQLNLLADKYRVVTYSRRFNYPNVNNYDARAFSAFSEANDLQDFVQKLNIQKFHLVGHSFGGLVALNYAMGQPHKLYSLILSEPALVKWLPEIEGCENWSDSVQTRLIEEVKVAFEKKDQRKVMKELFEFFVGMDLQDQLPPDALQAMIDNLQEVRALVHTEDPFAVINKSAVSKLSMPILLFTTKNTMPLLQCTNTELIHVLPDARHYHLSDAGHDLWYTHPQVLADYLHQFISDRN